MDLTNLSELKNYLRQHNLWLNKKLGQHFLVDRGVLEKILEVSDLTKDDTVVEIGPGLGVLTEELAKKAKLVLAIEKDRKLCELLRQRFKNRKNVKIICDDILFYSLSPLPSSYKLVANLPYAITSPIIRKFLETENKPKLAVLMVQKEVGERICAKPGNSERSILTLMVEFYGQAEIIRIVPRAFFFPAPAIDSAIIKIVPLIGLSAYPLIASNTFFAIVKAGFSSKRRQIKNSLKNRLELTSHQIDAILKEGKINPALRAEDLTLEDWLALAQIFSKTIQDS
ncbi:ribosomal RNA small subunit methyltransferase A [Candidatus Berkelbacteria bacterium]|nr:ribosomal RNA small subunit methyltransferase A [Candidatus Berkelbacteria bacterium]